MKIYKKKSQKNRYIFGGWDGTKRLNDLYVLEVASRVWTKVQTVAGVAPKARAGMSLSFVGGLL
jgi:leucine-zipper-like transcriptional regulator 1